MHYIIFEFEKSKGVCEIEIKIPGQRCYSSQQCTSNCCTREYECRTFNSTEPCKEDTDETGLIVGFVIAAIGFASAIIASHFWSKEYKTQ